MARTVVLAVTSDQHTNSTLGLCPDEGVRLDDGGTYKPSKPQRWTWQGWTSYWKEVDRIRRDLKADLYCIFNGDLHEGQHHRNTQVISQNPETQAYVSERVFGIPKALHPKRVFVVRGTEAHAGPGGSSDEATARWLKAERDEVSQTWSHWHLRLEVNGVLIDCQHHPGTHGKLPWTQPQAMQRLAFLIWAEHMQRGLRAPDLAIRSHRHQYGDSYKIQRRTRAVITPAWQLKTSFAHKVASESIADIGGMVVVIKPNGYFTVEPILYQPELPPIWRAS